jgi:hypothetical protein
VPECESNPFGKALEQQLDCWRRLLAVRALKIRVFDHRDRGVLWTQHMIHRGHRRAQLEEVTRRQRRTGGLI